MTAPRSSCAPAGSRAPSRRGFALLITVTLLAFLVLLLVSLATVTRVETQVASNGQNLQQARQNALMALNIAIGQLQRFAGPDQRVTTTADLVATTNSLGTPTTAVEPYSTVPHIAISPGGRYWTAVWGNKETSVTYLARPNQIPPTSFSSPSATNTGRGITPEFLNWLVSGNESASVSLNGTQGGVTASTAPVFSPALTITPALSSATTATDSLTFSDPGNTPGVLLVGPASTTGDATDAAKKTASIAAGNYVVAPLVSITVPASAVPGQGAVSTATAIGGYAYWIGDEGVKARVNLRTPSNANPADRFVTAQRSALEFMNLDAPNATLSTTVSSTGINGFGTPAVTTDDTLNFDYTKTTVSNILTPRQLALAGTATSTLSAIPKVRFHDVTTFSNGVLSDTYAGGLKKDITADIADPSAGGNNLGNDRPADSDPVFKSLTTLENTSSPGLPRWTHLRNWARVKPDVANAIDPTGPAARAAGIFPIFANNSLGLDYYFDFELGPAATPQPVDKLVLKMAYYPFFVLNNPYPFTIAAKDYDVIVRFNKYAQFKLEIDNNEDHNYKHLADVSLSTLAMTPYPMVGIAPPESYFRFRLHGEVLPPGQRHIYILKTDGLSYSPGDPPPELVRADGATGTAMSLVRKFIMTGPTITDPTLFTTSRVRLRSNTSSRTGGNVSTPSSYDPVDYADTRIAYTKTSVIMTEADAFAGKTWNDIITYDGQSKWYQSMVDTVIMQRCVAPGGVYFTPIGRTRGTIIDPNTGVEKPAFINVASELASNISVGDLLNSRFFTVKANSAFRTSPLYEGHGWYSSTYHIGVPFGSTVRYIATGNIRAPYVQPSNEEVLNPLPITGKTRGIADMAGAVISGSVLAGDTTDDGLGGATAPHPGMGYNGLAYDRYSTGFGSEPDSRSTTPAILWDLLDSPDRLLSLGQLQHAPFSRYGFQSSYLFGNSYADMRVQRNLTYTTNDVADPTGATQALYDTSWLLNRALWDKYFVSGVPSTWTQSDINAGTALPNARMTYYSGTSTPAPLDTIHYGGGTNKAYDLAAANLMVAGSFNINSTSEQAWRAVLANSYRLPLDTAYANSGDGVETAIPYPRFSHNISAIVTPAVGIYQDMPVTMRPDPIITSVSDSQAANKIGLTIYIGNRGLYLNNPVIPANTSPQSVINELARSIVNEIRQRGPFLSMADFVNRPLTTTTDPNGIKGALQAGMDNMDPNVAQVNPAFLPLKVGGYKAPEGDQANGFTDRQFAWNTGSLLEHAVGGPYVDIAGVSSTNATNDPAASYRSGWAMAPKFLTQADILSSLGPILSPRSDTFVIRTYGEVRSPANASVVTGRAWCEAIVQRTPDYVDQTDPALSILGNATPPSAVNSTNANFGRKFKIISFKWLSPNDI